jgi:PKD repeat protein
MSVRHAIRDRRMTDEQRGMTLIETLLAVMLSALMVMPMMGWAGLALKEQVSTQERNISGTSLGLLRTYFVRDVTNAAWAAVDGPALTDCTAGTKGEQTLLVVGTDDRRVAYSLIPVDDFTSMLQRLECVTPGGAVVDSVDLAGDVIKGGTSARCNTGADLSDAAVAAGAGIDAKKKGSSKEEGSVSAASAAEQAACRRVTLQLTTSRLSQVALTATLRAGSTSDVPAAEAPVAVIAATPTSGARRLGVQFNGKDSTDPAGEALTYSWDFGDGGSSTDAAPLHSYSSVGTFTATLTVTNESGLASSTEVRITVSDNVPVAVISSPATGTSVSRGQEVTFSSVGSNDDLDAEFGGRIVGYAWDFGDGTTSTEAAPKKAYAAISPAGGYTVRLAVFDDAGQTASTETKVIVANRVPTVSIVASATSGVAPLTVDFSSIVVDETTLSPNPALTYAWNFGDGGTSTLADPPARTYTTTGSKNVTLTVTDDQGATATAAQTITVGAPLLAAPTGLRFVRSGTAVGTRNMDLSWSARTGATLYEVRLTCDGCSDVHTATSATTAVRVNGLRSARTYYFAAVRARNSTSDWGPWSANVRVRS